MDNNKELTQNPWNADCPSRELLELIADKWVMLLLPKLAERPRRNGELMRSIGGISQKMLTQTLRNMERDGLIGRRDFGEALPHVEYELTALGRSLAEPVAAMDFWVVKHFRMVEAARRSYDAESLAP
jgi:DNA-binding HxlR family transcriptional regulator